MAAEQNPKVYINAAWKSTTKLPKINGEQLEWGVTAFADYESANEYWTGKTYDSLTLITYTGKSGTADKPVLLGDIAGNLGTADTDFSVTHKDTVKSDYKSASISRTNAVNAKGAGFFEQSNLSHIFLNYKDLTLTEISGNTVFGGTGKESVSDAVTQDKASITYKTAFSRTAAAAGTLKISNGDANPGNTATNSSTIMKLPVETGYTKTEAQDRLNLLLNAVFYSGNASFENIVAENASLGDTRGGTETISASNTEKYTTFDQQTDGTNLKFTRKVGDKEQEFSLSADLLAQNYTQVVKNGMTYYVSNTDPEDIITPVYVKVMDNRSYSVSYTQTAKGKFTGTGIFAQQLTGYKTVELTDGSSTTTIGNSMAGGTNSFTASEKLSTATKNTSAGGEKYTSRTVTSTFSGKTKNTAAGSLSAASDDLTVNGNIFGYQTVKLTGATVTLNGGMIFEAKFDGLTSASTSATSNVTLYSGKSADMRQDYLNYSYDSPDAVLAKKVLKDKSSLVRSNTAGGAMNINQEKGYTAEIATNFQNSQLRGYSTLKVTSAADFSAIYGNSVINSSGGYEVKSNAKTGRDIITSSTQFTTTVTVGGTAVLTGIGGAYVNGYKNVTLADTSAYSLINVPQVYKEERWNTWDAITETNPLPGYFNVGTGKYDIPMVDFFTLPIDPASWISSAGNTMQASRTATGTVKATGATRISQILNYATVNLGPGVRVAENAEQGLEGSVNVLLQNNLSKSNYSRTLKAGTSNAAVVTEKLTTSTFTQQNGGTAVNLDSGAAVEGGIRNYQNVTLGANVEISGGIQRNTNRVNDSLSTVRTATYAPGTFISGGLIADGAAPAILTENGSRVQSALFTNGGSLKTVKKTSGATLSGDISGYQTVALENASLNGGIMLDTNTNTSKFKYERTSAGIDGIVNYNSADRKDLQKSQAAGSVVLNNVTNNDACLISGFAKVTLNNVNMTGTIYGGNDSTDTADTFVRMKKNEEVNLRTIKTVIKESAAGTLSAASDDLTVNGNIFGYQTVKLTGATVIGPITATSKTSSFTFTGLALEATEEAALGVVLPKTTDFMNFNMADYTTLGFYGAWSLSADAVQKAAGSITLTDSDLRSGLTGYQTVTFNNSVCNDSIANNTVSFGGTISGIGNNPDALNISLTKTMDSTGSITLNNSTVQYGINKYKTVTLDNSNAQNIEAGKRILTESVISPHGQFIWLVDDTAASGTLTLKHSNASGQVFAFQTVNVKADAAGNGASSASSLVFSNSAGKVKTALNLAKGTTLAVKTMLSGAVKISIAENAGLKVNCLESGDKGLTGTAVGDSITVGKNGWLLAPDKFDLGEGTDTLALTNAASGSETGSVFATNAAFSSWNLEKITGKGTVVCGAADVESVKGIAAAGVDVIGSTNLSAETARSSACAKPLSVDTNTIDQWIGAGNLNDFFAIIANRGVSLSSDSGLDGIAMEISYDNGTSWTTFENGGTAAANGCLRIGFEEGEKRASFDYQLVMS